MNDRLDNPEIIVQHWLDSAAQNEATMKHLLASGDYHWALFMGHLVVEKTIKALIVQKTGVHAPFTHDLLRLLARTGVSPSSEHMDWLDEITTFNLNARYDSYKQDFFKRCTALYTDMWTSRIEEIRQWLKTQF